MIPSEWSDYGPIWIFTRGRATPTLITNKLLVTNPHPYLKMILVRNLKREQNDLFVEFSKQAILSYSLYDIVYII